jgi:hypothetical protein
MSCNTIRIISGGQTGVDRAALDAALYLGIPCGGWCPQGRLAEDGPISDTYPLKETPSARYEERTLWNVRDADATMILVESSELSGGTLFTHQVATGLRKPCLVHVLNAHSSITIAADWIHRHGVQVLNVAGPRENGQQGIYRPAYTFVLNLLRFVEERSAG